MCIPHQMPTYFIGLIQSVLGQDVRRIEVQAEQRRREVRRRGRRAGSFATA